MPETPYRITFARSASKELESLDSTIVKRVVPKIRELAIDPRPSGCRKIVGSKDSWRIRVGDYRVIFRIDDQMPLVHVLVVRHRQGDAVILSREDYENLVETLELLSVPGFLDELQEAEADIAAGRTQSLEEVFGGD